MGINTIYQYNNNIFQYFKGYINRMKKNNNDNIRKY